MKKRKKGSISEEDISILFDRYSATTVLAILQEVAQVPDVKIDWNALVKNTTTGIASAREYQMIWRHLAYRDAIIDKLEDGAEPLVQWGSLQITLGVGPNTHWQRCQDDDSDLEYELEAFPSASSEALMEATACVKVLIASGLSSDVNLQNGSKVEAPLTINIPNQQTSRAPMQGTNITVPVSVPKQPLPSVTTSEGLEANGLTNGNLPARRKRKPWSSGEDMELVAAVQKYSEGNWANISKEVFKGERTASQLSQRWAIIRKRQGNLNSGGGSQLSEAQLAARRAVSLALNMPMGDNLKTACSNVGTNSNVTRSNLVHPTAAESASITTQSQQQPAPTAGPGSGTQGSLSKPRVITSKKSITNSTVSSDSMIKAAAVAAGARIATPSDAATLLKAAQAKNAVHIIPNAGSLIKSSGNGNPLPSPQAGPHPNVHYIRTGLSATPLPTSSSLGKNAAAPSILTTGFNSKSSGSKCTSILDNVTHPVHEDQDAITCKSPKNQIKEEQDDISISAPGELVLEDASGKSSEKKIQEDRASASGIGLNEQIEADQISNLDVAPIVQVQENQTILPSSEGMQKSLADFIANSKCSASADTAWNDPTVIVENKGTDECKKMNDEIMTDLPVGDGDCQTSVNDISENRRGGEEDLPRTDVEER